jgi:hypothetical protein
VDDDNCKRIAEVLMQAYPAESRYIAKYERRDLLLNLLINITESDETKEQTNHGD